MRVEKIFFDMDGVLADFDRGIKELCRLPPRDQEIEDSEADDRMWDRIRKVDHFYNHLELIPGAKEMFLPLNRCRVFFRVAAAGSKKGIVIFLSRMTTGRQRRGECAQFLYCQCPGRV